MGGLALNPVDSHLDRRVSLRQAPRIREIGLL